MENSSQNNVALRRTTAPMALLKYLRLSGDSSEQDSKRNKSKRMKLLKAISFPCIVVFFHWLAMSNVFLYIGGLICSEGWSATWVVRCGYFFGFIQLFLINLSVMWFFLPPTFGLDENAELLAYEGQKEEIGNEIGEERDDNETTPTHRRMEYGMGYQFEIPQNTDGIRSVN